MWYEPASHLGCSLGTTISNDEWSVAVNSLTPDATEQAMASNQFNQAPAEGRTYALANITTTCLGVDSSIPLLVSIDYVTAAGNVVESDETLAVIPDQNSSSELLTAASVTGDIGLMIPSGDDGLLRVPPGILADQVFVAIR
ncbi:MAG: hypothetical protein GX454_06430 [Brooklawnia sp.]|nr:hypothetical protein [Brooklawnia sp.]